MQDFVRVATPEAEGTNQYTAHIITSELLLTNITHSRESPIHSYVHSFRMEVGSGPWGSQGAEEIPRRRTKPRPDTSGSFLGK